MSNDALLALLEQHVLPPVAGLMTPWTTPFFAASSEIPSWLGAGDNVVTVARATNG